MPPTNANPLANQQTEKSEPASQQQQRPPLYNAEDYASALRVLFSTTLNLPQAPPPATLILEHSTTHPPIIPGQGLVDMNKHNSKPEMSMKKFLNGSELLFKLEADLRSAFPSFVQEFVSGDSDGVTCILDALRTIHEALDHVQGLREQRKLVLDERSCVQCCALMMRNIDAVPKLLAYAHGLYPIVHCTVSTNTNTRVLALEILTSVCEQGGGDAYVKVSEAISTLRLRLGEPIRCKVLVGAISSAAAGVFQATGIKFLRSFVQSAPSAKYRVYLQVELEEAGLQVDVLRKSAELSPARESRLVLQEIEEWDRVCVDVDTVVRQNSQLRNSVATLQQEIATLKDKIKKQESAGPSASSSSSKYTKKRTNVQQPPPLRHLSSTPIQTITTPVDSEEEAEQIHQILEDLNNIVNHEMMLDNSNSTTTGPSSCNNSEIVPVLSSKPPFKYGAAPPEPNLFECRNNNNTSSSSSGGGGGVDDDGPMSVRHVVQQLESSNVFSSTLPNFNTGGLASKFANFKSSKLESSQMNWNENNLQEPGRVKSLENLDNFTLKWKYPVVDGGKSSSTQLHQQQQPNSLLVLQDYRMNRFGNKKENKSGGSGGLFSKKTNKKGPLHSHPPKTFQINMVKESSRSFNDLGGSSSNVNNNNNISTSSNSGGSSPERVTDLPSGLY